MGAAGRCFVHGCTRWSKSPRPVPASPAPHDASPGRLRRWGRQMRHLDASTGMLQLTGHGTSRTRKELHDFCEPELMGKIAGPGDDRIPTTSSMTRRPISRNSPTCPRRSRPDRRRLAELPAGAGGGGAHPRLRARMPASSSCCASPRPRSCRNTPISGPRVASPCPSRRLRRQRRPPRRRLLDNVRLRGGGRYAERSSAISTLFGRDRVMVALFEDLVADDPATRPGSRPSSASASPRARRPG